MFNNRILVPESGQTTSRMVSELAQPQALLQTPGGYTCRSQDDRRNVARAQQLFNNPTKQQRYREYQKH